MTEYLDKLAKDGVITYEVIDGKPVVRMTPSAFQSMNVDSQQPPKKQEKYRYGERVFQRGSVF